jgi:hypothetical protein
MSSQSSNIYNSLSIYSINKFSEGCPTIQKSNKNGHYHIFKPSQTNGGNMIQNDNGSSKMYDSSNGEFNSPFDCNS